MRNNLIQKAVAYLNADLPTKYRIIDYYNANCGKLVKSARRYRVQYSDNWCATFTSTIAHQCGLTKDQFPYECGVQEQVKIAIEKGTFTTDISQVQKGDLIIYDWNGDNWADHVGFVVMITTDNIQIIEGNIKNTVGYRTIPKTSKTVQGYIKVGATDVKKPIPDPSVDRIANLARLTWAGEFGTGEQRRTLLGGDYEAVQKYINVFYV